MNTATGCGFTPQYEGLKELYKKHTDQGFEILDFPCNQFLGQAPGTDEEIANFCQLKYGTSFKTFTKIDVNGKNAGPLDILRFFIMAQVRYLSNCISIWGMVL